VAKRLAHDFGKKFEVFGFYERELKELAAQGFPRHLCDRIHAAQNSNRFTYILTAFIAARDMATVHGRFDGLARTMEWVVDEMFNAALEHIDLHTVDQSVVDDLNDILSGEIEFTSFGFELRAA
jgi:hypothetical protein